MAAREIIVWRHGRTEYNVAGRFQGQLDIELDQVGRRQAHEAALHLALRTPTAIVASDLKRAAATAGALGDRTGLPITYDEGLRELNAGQWQGKVRSEIEAGWPEEFAAYRNGEDVQAGGGERRSEFSQRWADAVTRHAEALPDDGVLVVVSHGAVMRSGLVTLLGWDFDTVGVRLGGFDNCHWSTLQSMARGGWRLHEHNVGPVGAEEGAEG